MASNPYDPAMSPHTGTSGHLSHCDNSGKREKKGGVVGGKQKNKKSNVTEKHHSHIKIHKQDHFNNSPIVLIFLLQFDHSTNLNKTHVKRTMRLKATAHFSLGL